MPSIKPDYLDSVVLAVMREVHTLSGVAPKGHGDFPTCLVLGQSLSIVVIGIVVGLLGSLGLTRVLENA